MSDFLESFAVSLNNYHHTRLIQIDTFDYEPVKRKVSPDEGVVETAQLAQGIENLKRYYAVALLDPLNLHAVSEQVDPFWHSHVLFTSE